KTHWAYQPLQRPRLPSVSNASWCQTPLDRFILAQLEQHGLTPSPRADRRTLVRRLALDLLGLPPSPDEVRQFTHDARPDAYGLLIEQYLASPRYGERWGRHWLDVARY